MYSIVLHPTVFGIWQCCLPISSIQFLWIINFILKGVLYTISRCMTSAISMSVVSSHAFNIIVDTNHASVFIFSLKNEKYWIRVWIFVVVVSTYSEIAHSIISNIEHHFSTNQSFKIRYYVNQHHKNVLLEFLMFYLFPRRFIFSSNFDNATTFAKGFDGIMHGWMKVLAPNYIARVLYLPYVPTNLGLWFSRKPVLII